VKHILSRAFAAMLALSCAGIVAGCGKKPAPAPNEEPKGISLTPPPASSGATSDYVLFARLDAKAIREGSLFTELKQAVEKNGITKMWDDGEAGMARELGFKPTDVNSVTVVVAEMPPRAEPKMVVIVASSKPLPKGVAFLGPKPGPPDARGFYKSGRALIHYPDNNTAVLVHPDLAQKYLDGYAKDRTGWPLTADLTKAAAGHTAFAMVNVTKLPLNELSPRESQEFGSLTSAKSLTLTADLAGKSLKLTGRAGFADAATAEKAAAKLREFHGEAVRAVDAMTKGDAMPLPAFKPAMADVQRGVKDAKFEVSGSDVVLSGGIALNLDINKLVADAVKDMKDTAPRLTAQNNLKQMAVALHNHASTFQDLVPVHGHRVQAKPNEKPLLSWRVALLPYIEQDNLYRQFKLDEPWDSEHNKKLIPLMPKIYASPAKPGKPGYTPYQMVVGPSAMRPPAMRISTVQDGTSNTIAVVEAAEPVIWTKPDDVMLPEKELPKDFRKKFGGEFPGGFHAMMWDGSVRFVKDSVSDRTLGFALNPADGNVLGADW
jgi:hypothetical protein